MTEREVELGGHRARIVRPRAAMAGLVLAHGAGAGMRSTFLAALAAALAEQRVATARWEFPYMSRGKGPPPRLPDAIASVRAVWNAARARFRALPLFAGGRSFGGRMTSNAHASEPLAGMRGLVFLAFPLHPPGKPGVERAEHLARARGPLLFVQGDRDELADAMLLERALDELDNPIEVQSMVGAGHDFGDKLVEPIARGIAAWMSRILS